MAKRIIGSSSGIKNPRLMHPSREWWIGLFVAAILFSVIAVWSTQTYSQYRNDAMAENILNEVNPVVYRKSLVESVLADFAAKAEVHNSYLQSAVTTSELFNIEVAASNESLVEEEVFIDDVLESATTTQPTQPTAGMMLAPEVEADLQDN